MAEDELLSLWYRIQREEFSTGYAGARNDDIYSDYIERIEDDIQINRDLTIVLDAGNGVAGPMAVDLFRELGADVIELFCDVDGHFPNHHPDPGEEENLEYLRKSVLSNGADLGLAFDGDGDRVAVLDNEGNIIWPDRLLMLLIEDILPRKPGSDVIFDVKSSRHLAPLINRLGGRPTMWKTGHSLMKRKLKELKASVGGEFSGHFYIGERWYGFDCGLYAGARIVEILSSRNASAAEVFAALPEDVSTAEITINTTEDRKFSLITQLAEDSDLRSGAVVHETDGLRIEYPDGWGLIRASNTTPRLTLRFAGDRPETIERIQGTMKQALTRYAPDIQIPF
jgi:phosphomannomutase/phosphoglucomutase